MPDELQGSGVESAVAAEPQAVEGQSQVEGESGGAAVAGSDDRVETAFAKRFAAEREKMEKEFAERYKDYDVHKSVAEYFRELNEVNEVSELNQLIELEKLKKRAEASQVTPEFQKRIEELELKAAEADTLRQQNELQSWYRGFRTDLEKFATERGVDANELENFMQQNRVGNMEIAYKAIKFADAEAKREEIEKAAVAKYLDSKKAPKAEGSGAAAHVSQSSPKTWDQARAGALEMMRSANKPV